MKVRLFESEDTEQIAQLFQNTVRKINIRDYSAAQIKAWSPDDLNWRNWRALCGTRFTYVATANQKILGFGELEANGHIDCFYVHYRHQRQGVGHSIYQAIEIKAQELSLNRIFTEASITAKTFFLKQGFKIISPQEVSCRGEVFTNYSMTKELYG
ncbi:MAG: GNAT family N-acetyltransferase [Cyanobacteria bacterium J06600_6]